LGAVAVYLGTWLDNAFFYLEFQRPLLAQCRESGGGVILERAQEVQEATSPEWGVDEKSGLELPLPPGRLVALREEGEFIVAQFQEGRITFQSLPAGSIAGTLREELELLGEKAPRGVSDAGALREVMEENLGNYRFSWGPARLRDYSARILSKMLLWENKPARRLLLASRQDPPRAAALVEYESGAVKILITRENGVLVVQIPADAPASWKTSAANWLAGKKR
jgi:hypothetical protein